MARRKRVISVEGMFYAFSSKFHLLVRFIPTSLLFEGNFFRILELSTISTIHTTLKDNLTLSIFSKAEAGGYDILSQSCYDAQSAIAHFPATERPRSPAILQLFAIKLMYGGPFLQFCLTVAHSASVPMAVHLDHATDEEHLELAIDEENIAIAKLWVERAIKAGVVVEVELGKLEGGELMMIEGANLMTQLHGKHSSSFAPSVTFMAPTSNPAAPNSIKASSKLCMTSSKAVFLTADELPDELFKECIKNGVSKNRISPNYPYHTKNPFPDAIEEATEVFAVCERMMKVFGSVEKAD
ncbi:aldolase [Dendrothele bispora CBS 962.96]|uniref:Fructose-bisphosphate aldolase n=1 Tax=Dendrothele bispora (strain CBS 962.96) TaxID=1314807 RepID=A0A4S8KX21_DENBC|nr:aldolase [Dendrothele bispora CBS 962.96]